ncbi:MAG: co-chaperone GroES [Gammaproteobacteria bacterium]|nr:co-chaperone GroES [Gammaproteobacteria bacterium]
MSIRPLQDRVVIKRVEEETTSAGGIVLPGSATEKPAMGEVVAVGPGKTLESGEVRAVGVQVGENVFFKEYGGNKIKVDGQELVVLAEDDILAVVA